MVLYSHVSTHLIGRSGVSSTDQICLVDHNCKVRYNHHCSNERSDFGDNEDYNQTEDQVFIDKMNSK